MCLNWETLWCVRKCLSRENMLASEKELERNWSVIVS